jgi:hypothetical protein
VDKTSTLENAIQDAAARSSSCKTFPHSLSGLLAEEQENRDSSSFLLGSIRQVLVDTTCVPGSTVGIEAPVALPRVSAFRVRPWVVITRILTRHGCSGVSKLPPLRAL